MNCKKAHRQIHLFAELSKEERDQLLIHIKECKECMELTESMKFMDSIVNRISKVKVEPINSVQLTSTIMSEISKQESLSFSLFDWILNYLELKQLKFAMAVVSAMLIVLLAAEQSRPLKIKDQHASEISNHSIKTTILNTKDFQQQLQKYKATEKFRLLNSCKNPFGESRYTAECLLERNEWFKTL